MKNKFNITIDAKKEATLMDMSVATLKDRYMYRDETTAQEVFMRVANAYGSDKEHAQRLYNYMSDLWFMPASPILSNGGTKRGLPISCFLNEASDNLASLNELWFENVWLAASGGGIGSYYGNIRSLGEPIKDRGESGGIIPFIKMMDSQTTGISQGGLRRGSAATYLPVWHPEIEEFIDVRRPTGGDANRRSLNIHHGVVIDDKFMQCVEAGTMYDLISPHTKEVLSQVNARELWIKILNARIETGEPYILFIDNVKKGASEVYKKAGLECKTSNLCVAPETLILTASGWREIQSCANEKTTIWNGFEWSEVMPVKTGENQRLKRVRISKCFDGSDLPFGELCKIFSANDIEGECIEIDCTDYHKWYIKPKGIFAKFKKTICKTTSELKAGDEIISYSMPDKFFHNGKQKQAFKKENFKISAEILSVKSTDRISDTYCFTEPKRNMAVFNGILTGNCSEIMLHTGTDPFGKERTAVCCLSSINLERYKEYEANDQFFEDILRFLDNVLQDFIDNAPTYMERAKYSAMRERSVGLGVMGFFSFLQQNMIAPEGVVAKSWNNRIFKRLAEIGKTVNAKLAKEKGACPDAEHADIQARFSNMFAVAPTASISNISNSASPGVEPYAANVFTQKTLSGSFVVKNKALEKLLIEKNQNSDEIWSFIATNNGSVQELKFLTQDEKDVFKTAPEFNQMWLIEHAADRQQYIDQGQSVNLFFPANVSKKDLNATHFAAWKKGLKSLYYCRSQSIQRADNVSNMSGDKAVVEPQKYEECLSCQ